MHSPAKKEIKISTLEKMNAPRIILMEQRSERRDVITYIIYYYKIYKKKR